MNWKIRLRNPVFWTTIIAAEATHATKATQDAEGNVITSTYATKAEVTAATLVWGTF